MNTAGEFLLDGLSALHYYGIRVAKGGYAGLVALPKFKRVDTTEWPEADGVEADLCCPVFDKRTATVQFLAADKLLLHDFLAAVSDGAVHRITFPELGRAYDLRLTQNGISRTGRSLGMFSLTFVEDNFTLPRISIPMPDTPCRAHGFLLDGDDITAHYGVFVLENSEKAILKAAPVRDNLTVSPSGRDGTLYDSSAVTFRTSTLPLNIFMRAKTIGEFWTRYEALMTALCKEELRSLECRPFNVEFGCYYSSMAVDKFSISTCGHVWCEMTLTLALTDSRPLPAYGLLGLGRDTVAGTPVRGIMSWFRIKLKNIRI